MSTTRESSRRVGVWAARKRASAAQDDDALLRARRPRVELPDTGLEHLVPVELGVLAQERVAERGDEPGRVAAAAQVAGGDRAGSVDVALDLPALVELGEVAVVASGEAGGGTLRKRSR